MPGCLAARLPTLAPHQVFFCDRQYRWSPRWMQLSVCHFFSATQQASNKNRHTPSLATFLACHLSIYPSMIHDPCGGEWACGRKYRPRRLLSSKKDPSHFSQEACSLALERDRERERSAIRQDLLLGWLQCISLCIVFQIYRLYIEDIHFLSESPPLNKKCISRTTSYHCIREMMQLILPYITLHDKASWGNSTSSFRTSWFWCFLVMAAGAAAHAKSRMGPIMVNPAPKAQGTLLSTRNGMHDT